MSLYEEISLAIWEPEAACCVQKLKIRGRFNSPFAVSLLLALGCGKITSFVQKVKQLSSNKEEGIQIQVILSSVRSKREERRGREYFYLHCDSEWN